VGQPYKLRRQPWPDARKRERAVVEAAAHSKPATELIKPYKWKQHRIQSPGRPFQPAVKGGLRDAKSIGCERCRVSETAENQSAMMNRVQNRKIESDTALPSDVGIDPGVDFTVVGQIDCHMAGAVEIGVSQQVQGQLVGSTLLLFRRKSPAFLPESLAEFTA
jgi:hypothetical protein